MIAGNTGHSRRRGRRALHGVDDRRAAQHHRASRDYTGQLQLETTLRVTDRDNGPSLFGTGQDTPLQGDGAVHRDRGHHGGLDLLREHDGRRGDRRGHVKEGRRSIWQLGQVRVNDGGADGVASTTPNSPVRDAGRLRSLELIVRVSTTLPVPAARGVGHGQAARHAALRHQGLLGFRSRGRELPERFAAGETYRVRLLFFGVVPAWWHEIHVVRLDDAHREIVTAEHGGPVKEWNHRITVDERGPWRSHYTDEIEIARRPADAVRVGLRAALLPLPAEALAAAGAQTR